MKYLIGHIFDNEFTRAKFQMEGESAENIRRYKNRNIINFMLDDGTYSEVKITSAEGAMGLGASNIIEDESALISDHFHSFVMRMLGDQIDNFICKVGNPFESFHFRASADDPRYHKIIIDYQQAIDEGRLSTEYVEEMRELPNFRVLYEVKFPPEDQSDDQG